MIAALSSKAKANHVAQLHLPSISSQVRQAHAYQGVPQWAASNHGFGSLQLVSRINGLLQLG